MKTSLAVFQWKVGIASSLLAIAIAFSYILRVARQF